MKSPNYIHLEELDIYQLAMEIGNMAWSLADNWEYFQKKSIGIQLVRAADSIAANISEGYGRFRFNDKRTFYYYSRGSLTETKTWCQKAKDRNLVSEEIFNSIFEKLKTLHLALNVHIKSLPIN